MDIQRNLMNETVEQAGLVDPLAVAPDVSTRDVLRHMKEQRVGSVLVSSDGKLVGIFTERDALHLLAARADLAAPISDVMSKDPVTLDADASVATAIKKMNDGGYRRLPIVDDKGAPVGVVKVTAIIHYLVEHFPRTVYNLPPDPHTVMREPEGA